MRVRLCHVKHTKYFQQTSSYGDAKVYQERIPCVVGGGYLTTASQDSTQLGCGTCKCARYKAHDLGKTLPEASHVVANTTN